MLKFKKIKNAYVLIPLVVMSSICLDGCMIYPTVSYPYPQSGQPPNFRSDNNLALKPSAFSSDETRMMLNAHNQTRYQLGLSVLQWSPGVASFAQAWADHLVNHNGCVMQHRPRSGPLAQRYGENIAISYHGVPHSVQMWLDERQYYHGQPLSESNRLQIGHYTQMVWNESRFIGCGKAMCGKQTMTVCNYEPRGNFRGERPY